MKRALSPSERDPHLPRHLDRSAPLVLTDNMEIREVEVGQLTLPAHVIHNLIIEQARIAVAKENSRYRVEAAIPLSDLGLKEPGGKTLKADFGVLFGDPDGAMTMLRSYWSNQATGLVNDVPGEITLSPNLWGTAAFERKNPQ